MPQRGDFPLAVLGHFPRLRHVHTSTALRGSFSVDPPASPRSKKTPKEAFEINRHVHSYIDWPLHDAGTYFAGIVPKETPELAPGNVSDLHDHHVTPVGITELVNVPA